MKYLRLFEDFDSYDPYELMIIPPNKKAQMIIQEIQKRKPNLDLMRDLINLGANVDWKDEENYGLTALYFAARDNRPEIARMLIDAGADVNIQNEEYDGQTALHYAAMYNEIEIARTLIDAGADVNIQDEWDRTALHYAADFNRSEIARMLVGAGADVNIQNTEGRIPYDLAKTHEMKNILQP